MLRPRTEMAPCWICGRPGLCVHREVMFSTYIRPTVRRPRPPAEPWWERRLAYLTEAGRAGKRIDITELKELLDRRARARAPKGVR